jgi:hypothetical protein
LLNRPGLLLEGVTPTTGAVTELWWGEQEDGRVLDDQGELIYQGPLDEVIPYTDQRTEQGASVSGRGARIVLRLDAEVLRNLVIIDTPGLGANARDDKVTYESLYLADAALLVVNGLQPGGEDSLLLSERLRTSGRRFLVTVSRLDQVDRPDEALAAARKTFGAIADGDPIGVVAPAALRDLADLAAAQEAYDTDAVGAAEAALDQHGYTELQDRLRDSFLAGDAASTRATTTLAGAARQLYRLVDVADRAVTRAQNEAEALQSEFTQAERHIRDSLLPRRNYLDQKIIEAVEVHVGGFIRDLADAVDVFIDRLAYGGAGLGAQLIWANMDLSPQGRADGRRRLNERLADDFNDLFPPSQLEITVRQITRSVRTMMEAEWGAAGAEWNDQAGAAHIDPTGLVREVVQQLANIAAALAANIAATVALLLIPGGALVDLAWLILASGVGKRQVNRLPEKVAHSKRVGRVRVRNQRRELTDQLSGQFIDINRRTADQLQQAAERTSTAQRSTHADLLRSIDEWTAAREDLKGLIASGDELAGARR